ncbi:MAG: hypothetical protein WC878_08505, partial [Candidatus Paceibacterota bacterium]
LNKIWNAGKLFEPKPEQSPKPTPDSAENTPSNVKHKKSVIGAFMDKQEDPFKEKVEAVLKEIEKTEPASAPAMADEKENPSPLIQKRLTERDSITSEKILSQEKEFVS